MDLVAEFKIVCITRHGCRCFVQRSTYSIQSKPWPDSGTLCIRNRALLHNTCIVGLLVTLCLSSQFHHRLWFRDPWIFRICSESFFAKLNSVFWFAFVHLANKNTVKNYDLRCRADESVRIDANTERTRTTTTVTVSRTTLHTKVLLTYRIHRA